MCKVCKTWFNSKADAEQIRISFVLQTTAEGDKQNVKGYTSIAYMLCDTVEIQIKRDGFNTQRHW